MNLQSVKCALILIVILGLSRVKAQENFQPIDLETVLQLGGANNLTIQEYQEIYQRSIANLHKSREWWLPDLFAGTFIHKRTGAAMNADGRFYTDIDRQFFWGGIGLDFHWDFGKGIYETRANNLSAQSQEMLTTVERNQALLKIISSYYDFLSAQLYYKAYKSLVSQGDSVAMQIRIQVETGIRYESELLLTLSNQNHLKIEMLNAKMEYHVKSAELVKLLNLSPSIQFVAVDSVLIPIRVSNVSRENIVVDSVYKKRPEITAANLKLQSLMVEKKTTTTALFFPKLKIGGYTSMFGDIFSPTYPTNAVNASLIWRIPTGRLTYAGDLKMYRAQIAIQENKMDQIKTEINEDVLRSRDVIQIAEQQMRIALEGNDLAEKALNQSLQRQSLGTMRPFEVIQTQEVFIKMRMDYLRSVATHNKAQYQLHVALGNNL